LRFVRTAGRCPACAINGFRSPGRSPADPCSAATGRSGVSQIRANAGPPNRRKQKRDTALEGFRIVANQRVSLRVLFPRNAAPLGRRRQPSRNCPFLRRLTGTARRLRGRSLLIVVTRAAQRGRDGRFHAKGLPTGGGSRPEVTYAFAWATEAVSRLPRSRESRRLDATAMKEEPFSVSFCSRSPPRPARAAYPGSGWVVESDRT
jgi:hypothetical protein